MRGVYQPKGWSLPFLFLVFDVEDNFFILYTYYPVEPYELPIIKFFQPVVTCESYVKGAFIKVSIWKVEHSNFSFFLCRTVLKPAQYVVSCCSLTSCDLKLFAVPCALREPLANNRAVFIFKHDGIASFTASFLHMLFVQPALFVEVVVYV